MTPTHTRARLSPYGNRLVSDEQILAALRASLATLGLLLEPAGAAGLAALLDRRAELPAARLATILCGGNLSPELEPLLIDPSYR